MVLTNKNKDTKIKEIVDSFNERDKFKPVAYLSEGSVSEPFLVKKRIWTNVKEVGTFLAIIIPVIVTIVQLVQPFVKFNP